MPESKNYRITCERRKGSEASRVKEHGKSLKMNRFMRKGSKTEAGFSDDVFEQLLIANPYLKTNSDGN